MTGVDIAWGALLWVALGGGVGAALRYAVDVIVTPRWPRTFPLATFVVNVTGSFLLGLVMGLWSAGGPGGGTLLPLVGTGLLGGYTTFSTASYDAVRLARSGAPGTAVGYAVGTMAVTIAAALAGLWLGGLWPSD